MNITIHWVYHSTRYIPLLFWLNSTKTVLTDSLFYFIVVKKMSRLESAHFFWRPLESIQLASFSSQPPLFLIPCSFPLFTPHPLRSAWLFYLRLHMPSAFQEKNVPVRRYSRERQTSSLDLSSRPDFRSSYNACFTICFPQLSLVQCLSLMSSHTV